MKAQPLDTADIKGLFYQLVQAVGKSTAAAAYLGISEQRVRALYAATNSDLPTLMQVITLESVVQQPIVSGAIAASVQVAPKADPMHEAVEVMSASTKMLSAVQRRAPKREILAALVEVEREARDVAAALPDDETD